MIIRKLKQKVNRTGYISRKDRITDLIADLITELGDLEDGQ